MNISAHKAVSDYRYCFSSISLMRWSQVILLHNNKSIFLKSHCSYEEITVQIPVIFLLLIHKHNSKTETEPNSIKVTLLESMTFYWNLSTLRKANSFIT